MEIKLFEPEQTVELLNCKADKEASSLQSLSPGIKGLFRLASTQVVSPEGRKLTKPFVSLNLATPMVGSAA